MSIKAIIFGATGMVGEGVLHECLKDAGVESVLVIGRRPCGVKHEKLKEVIHNDFFDYSAIEGALRGYTACFFCLGVSSIGNNEAEYTRVTYDLTMQAARTLSRLNPDMTLCYVSGLGTNDKGRSMWARVKGKTENEVAKLPFKAVYLFRPGFINPTKGTKNANPFAKVFAPFYPVWKILFRKYICTLEDLGRAMIHVASDGAPKRILGNPDIAHLGGISDNPGK